MSAAAEPPQPNPGLLIFDSDALIQVLLADQARAFVRFKRQYQMHCAIVEAVEAEMLRTRTNKKKQLVEHEFLKARDSGNLLVLSETTIGGFTSNDPHATYDSIETMAGRSLAMHSGERYSHAAGVVLRVPIVSNDEDALVTAAIHKIQLANPILRAYDLFVFLHQIGDLSANDCDQIRQRLDRANDTPHSAFKGRAFNDGLTLFYPRLVDGGLAALGSSEPITGDDVRLVISKTHQ